MYNDSRVGMVKAATQIGVALRRVSGFFSFLRPKAPSLPPLVDRPSLDWPYFDADWYLQKYPDVAAAGVDPKLHYVLHGRFERRRPSIYFDPDYYVDTFFGGDLEADALDHYVTEGWKEGFCPNPYFSAPWYLKSNSDVAEAGEEPMRHYVWFGWKEGRNPSPYFDVALYLRDNADVRLAGLEPMRHYMEHGFSEGGRNPNGHFDGNWYRENYGAYLSPDQDPLLHYIGEGFARGFAPAPNFDPEHYRAAYPDVKEIGEPLAHYLNHGRFERRSPYANAIEDRDEAVEEWAKVNAFSWRRASLLSKALGVPISPPTPCEEAQSTFLKAIDGVDCVSFDIFDTLVERRSGRPETVFALLAENARAQGFRGEDFAGIRKAAETRARQIAGIREVTIAEIYGQVSEISGLPLDACLALADIESTFECELCEPKPIGIALYRVAEAAKLRIFLLSDIYLPRSTVEAILKNAGLCGHERLFVSSELGASKHYGGLYKLLLEATGLEPQRIVHVGDNEYSDGVVPHGMGIRTLRMQKSESMTRSRVLGAWFGTDISAPQGLWKAIVGGELIHRESRASDKLATPDSPDIANLVGAQVLGPVLLAFAQFTARRARLMGYRHLHFASRDGFYLKAAYDLLRDADENLPPSSYFLASRKACRAAGINSYEDILAVAEVDHFPMKLRDMLKSRFLLDDQEMTFVLKEGGDDPDRIIVNSRSDEKLRLTLKALSARILRRCQSHADAYKGYLREIGLDGTGNAIVDIGYRGTVQDNISSLAGSRIDGVYFVTWPEVSKILLKGLRYDAFISSNGLQNDPLVRYVQLLEVFFSATHGSVSHFEMVDGGPRVVLGRADASQRARQTLNCLRSGALSFVRDMVRLYPQLVAEPAPAPAVAVGPLIEFFRNPDAKIVDGLRQHLFEDSFGGETRHLVVPPSASVSYEEAIERSCWREGTASLWRATRAGMTEADWATASDKVDEFHEGTIRPAARPIN